MARDRPPLSEFAAPPLRSIPASVCDGCGVFGPGLHAAGTVDELGVACDCGGHQRHRSLWHFAWCPSCGGRGARCEACRWKGVVASWAGDSEVPRAAE